MNIKHIAVMFVTVIVVMAIVFRVQMLRNVVTGTA